MTPNLIIGNSHPSLHKLPPSRWTVIAKRVRDRDQTDAWIWLIADRYPSDTCAKLREDGKIITTQRRGHEGFELVARPVGKR